MSTGRNHNRFEQIVHYVIARTTGSELGATKLNKVLWFIDRASYHRTGQSMTGADVYIKKQFGPVPERISETLSQLTEAGLIVERQAPTPVGTRREFFSLKEPDVDDLMAREVALIHQVIDWVTPKTASDASESTHDALWDETPDGGFMTVAAGAVRRVECDEDAMNWASSEAARLGLNG